MINIYKYVGKIGKIEKLKSVNDISSKDKCLVFVKDPSQYEIEKIKDLTGAQSYLIEEGLMPEELPTTLQKKSYTLIKLLAPFKEEEYITVPFIMIAKRDIVIIIYKKDIKSILKLKSLLDAGKGKFLFQKGAKSVLVKIIDKINDEYLSTVNLMSKRIDAVEDNLTKGLVKDKDIIDVYNIGLVFTRYNRALSYNLNVIKKLGKGFVRPFIGKESSSLLEPLYRDLVEIMTLNNVHKETIDGLLNTQNMIISKQLNEVFKKISGFGLILSVIMLITGIYGMNLRYLPLAHQSLGFFILTGLMLLLSVIIYIILKRVKWV